MFDERSPSELNLDVNLWPATFLARAATKAVRDVMV